MLPATSTPDGAAPDANAAAGGGAPGRPLTARAVALLRRHWLVVVLLAGGLVLRALAVAAYHPALIYVDTLKYLYGASPGSEPFGYTVALRIVLLAGDLGAVAVIQHLLGLAMAVALYLVLLRRGASRWLAALAAAPVLLDAYELQMEHLIMPDVLFEALVLTGLVVLLWQQTVSVPFAVAAGLILGLAATVMQLGLVLVLPAVIYLLACGGGWRQALSRSAGLGLAFAVLVLGYCGVSYARDGHFWLAHRQSLTGRLAAAADCATLTLPPAVRPICPAPAQQALGPDWLEHSGQSPLYTTGKGRYIGDLNSAVLSQQPLRVIGSIARDAVRLFALTREPVRSVTPISRWQFQTGYPTYPPWTTICPAGQIGPGRLTPQDCMTQQQQIAKRAGPAGGTLLRQGGTIVVGVQRRAFGMFHASVLKPGYGGNARVGRPVAGFLRSYQLGGGYTPGPLLAVFALTGLAGSVLLLRRRLPGRTRRLALGCLLFTATAVAVLLTPDVYEFSWRYELPAVITLVPAGLLGIAAAVSLRQARNQAAAGSREPAE